MTGIRVSKTLVESVTKASTRRYAIPAVEPKVRKTSTIICAQHQQKKKATTHFISFDFVCFFAAIIKKTYLTIRIPNENNSRYALRNSVRFSLNQLLLWIVSNFFNGELSIARNKHFYRKQLVE